MRQFVLIAVLGSAAAVAMAAQSKVVINVDKTDANNGQQMYTSYCAPCHGVDGRGGGPKAQALTYAPTDLTQLSRNNNGVYPALHVSSVLKFGLENSGAGSKEMPHWHAVLVEMDNNKGPLDPSALRISNIVRYVETLQAH